jgi:hypothetical protein
VIRFDSSSCWSKSSTAVSTAVTARLGDAPDGGNEDGRGELGFRLRRILEQREEKTRFSAVVVLL